MNKLLPVHVLLDANKLVPILSQYVFVTKSYVLDGVNVDDGRYVLNALVPVHVLFNVNKALIWVSQYVLVTKSLVLDGVTVDDGR